MERALTPLDIVEQKTELQTCVAAPLFCDSISSALMDGRDMSSRLEQEHRTALVALDEIAQLTGKRPVYQRRGNIFFRADAQKVSLTGTCLCAGSRRPHSPENCSAHKGIFLIYGRVTDVVLSAGAERGKETRKRRSCSQGCGFTYFGHDGMPAPKNKSRITWLVVLFAC